MRFADKVVWITGGGSGIGRALALEFAREGAAVAVSGRRLDRLEETVAAVAGAGGKGLAVPCDVTDEEEVAAAVAKVVAELGRLDVAVANAGYSAVGAVEELPVEDWRSQFETNVFGLVATARHALPALRETGGRLVLMGSVAAYYPARKMGPYMASKAAVRAIGDTLVVELAGSGVSCTTVHPGYVESEIIHVDNRGRFVEGREERRPKKMIWSAEQTARAVLPAVHRRKREAILPGYGKAAAVFNRLAPGLQLSMAGGKGKKRG